MLSRRHFVASGSLLVPATMIAGRRATAAMPEWPDDGVPTPRTSLGSTIGSKVHYVLSPNRSNPYGNLTITAGASGAAGNYTVVRVGSITGAGSLANFGGKIRVEADYVWLWGLEATKFEIVGDNVVLRRCRASGVSRDENAVEVEGDGARLEYCEMTYRNSGTKPKRGLDVSVERSGKTFKMSKSWLHGIEPVLKTDGGGARIGSGAGSTRFSTDYQIRDCLFADVDLNYLLEIKAGYFNPGAAGTSTTQGLVERCRFIDTSGRNLTAKVRVGGGCRWLGNHFENSGLNIRGVRHVVAGNRITTSSGIDSDDDKILALTGSIEADTPNPDDWPTDSFPNAVDCVFYKNVAQVVIGRKLTNEDRPENIAAGQGDNNRVRGNLEFQNDPTRRIEQAVGTSVYAGSPVAFPTPVRWSGTSGPNRVGPLADL